MSSRANPRFDAAKRSQASDDIGAVEQDGLLTLDVLLNDTGGAAAKSIYSIDQLSPLTKTVAGAEVSLASGAGISVVAGKILYDQRDAWDHLGAGVTAHDVFTYTMQLGNGMTSVATVSVLVTGVNDAAMIGGVSTGSVKEDSALETSGMLVVADVDTGEDEVQPIAAATVGDNGYGAFEVLASGAWTYRLANDNPAVQSLTEGKTLTDSITVQSKDGTDTQVIEVTIVGTADGLTVRLPDNIGGTTRGSALDDYHIGGDSFRAHLVVRNTLVTGNGDDILDGGNAKAQYSNVNNQLIGGSGDDVIHGGDAEAYYSKVYNLLAAGTGRDTLIGGDGTALGSSVTNSYQIFENTTVIGGSAFNYSTVTNEYRGGRLSTEIFGGSSSSGGNVSNYFNGATGTGGDATGEGSRTVNYFGSVTTTVDILKVGGSASQGGYVDNRLAGNAGDDTLIGGSSDSASSAFNGLSASQGEDTVIAGVGNTQNIIYVDLSSGDKIVGSAGRSTGDGYTYLEARETVESSALIIDSDGWLLNGEFVDITNINGFSFQAGAGDDLLDFSDIGEQIANPMDGSIVLIGMGGTDTLIGASDISNTFDVDVSAGDVVVGGSLDDLLFAYGAATNVQVRATGGLNISGADISGIETAHLGAVTEALVLTGDFSRSDLAKGRSLSIGTSSSVDASGMTNADYGLQVSTSYTGPGSTIIGSAGSDYVFSNNSGDAVNLGGGNDYITLNGQQLGVTVIVDMGSGDDFLQNAHGSTIDLCAYGFETLDEVLQVSSEGVFETEAGSVYGVRIQLDAANSMTLYSTQSMESLTSLYTQNFIFAEG